MNTIGVGIIGCGNIAATYLRLASRFAGFQIRAVADQNPAAAQARATEFGVTALPVDALLASDDIALIINLTVPAAHAKVSAAILEAGKHVYSEKPLVLTLDEGRALAALAADRDLRIGAAPDTFLGGAHQVARALVDEGAIGRVHSGTCHVMSRGMEAWHPNPDFFFQPGGGPILDIGPYYVTNLIQLLGPVVRVAAIETMAFDQRTIGSGDRKGESIPVDVPTTYHALLSFESGAHITVSASWDVVAHRHGPMEIYGTEGTLFVPDPNFFAGTLEAAGVDGKPRSVDLGEHPFAALNETHAGTSLANYRGAGVADMAQAIAHNRPHRCGFDLALHAVDVMTGIERSAQTGAFVDMQTHCNRPQALNAAAASTLLG